MSQDALVATIHTTELCIGAKDVMAGDFCEDPVRSPSAENLFCQQKHQRVSAPELCCVIMTLQCAIKIVGFHRWGLTEILLGFLGRPCAFGGSGGVGNWLPIFLEAPNLWVRCSRLFFVQQNGPHISGSP